MYLQKVIIRKQFFVGVLQVKDENSGIRIHWSEVRDPLIRIRTKMSRIHNTNILTTKTLLLEGKFELFTR
jgi:hypothetical protein